MSNANISASYDGTSAWTDGGAGSYGDSAYIDPDDPYSGLEIGAPDAASLGSNATPIVISEESDPNFLDASSNGTAFSLIQSVIEITENGTAPEAAVNDGGATLSVIDIETGELNLSIPSLGIDVDLFANADDPAAITDGFASLPGQPGIGCLWADGVPV